MSIAKIVMQQSVNTDKENVRPALSTTTATVSLPSSSALPSLAMELKNAISDPTWINGQF